MYSTGFMVKTAKRLKSISITANNSLAVRSYVLDYYDANPTLAGDQYSSSTGQSVLSMVTQKDKNGALSLPPQSIQYDQGVKTFQLAPLSWSTAFKLEGYPPEGVETYPGDFNGDGKTDFMQYRDGYACIFSSTGLNFHDDKCVPGGAFQREGTSLGTLASSFCNKESLCN